MQCCWAVVAAAGSGSRLAAAGLDRPKQFIETNGIPLYWHSARTFSRVAGTRGIVFVFPPTLLAEAEAELAKLVADENFPLPVRSVGGGKTRQDSVRNALAALPEECDAVLVHDAARPFVTPSLIVSVLDAMRNGHVAVIPGVPLVDTVKQVNVDEMVAATVDREFLRAVQTPQGFYRHPLAKAHEKAAARRVVATDDAALMEEAGIGVFVVPGDKDNVKITTPADLTLLRGGDKDASERPLFPRTGFGYDVHAYGGSRPFVLGGVPIPSDVTVSAHSDGDVLLHALIDAILGCLGRGDIGALFPDSDPRFDGIESGVLLSETLRLAERASVKIVHADMTVVAQTPKIAPHRERIAANVAKLLGLAVGAVNVKATTEEKLGFTGEKKGVKAYAVVTALAP